MLDKSLHESINNYWYFKDLIWTLVKRDIKSRYRRSFLGLLWTLLNPLFFTFVLWIVFVSVFRSSLGNNTQFAPYLMAGVLTITYVNQGIIQAAESISSSSSLILKIRMNPIILVIANSIANLLNFFIGLVALVLVSLFSRTAVSKYCLLVLLIGFALMLFISGLGCIFGILFILFDDMKYIVGIGLQFVTYLTPVFYPKESLSSFVRAMVNLNPLTSFLDVFRNVFNGTESATLFDWIYMCSSAIFTFIVGLYVIKKFWPKMVVML